MVEIWSSHPPVYCAEAAVLDVAPAASTKDAANPNVFLLSFLNILILHGSP